MVLLGVRTMGDVIWGKYAPKTTKKWAWIGNFKLKHRNVKIAISQKLLIRSRPNLRITLRQTIALRGWSDITIIHRSYDINFLKWSFFCLTMCFMLYFHTSTPCTNKQLMICDAQLAAGENSLSDLSGVGNVWRIVLDENFREGRGGVRKNIVQGKCSDVLPWPFSYLSVWFTVVIRKLALNTLSRVFCILFTYSQYLTNI